MNDAFSNLEAEYCPPLDSALFSAIVSDFDLDNEHSLADAKATLDALKASASAEESSGFDPSGSGGYESDQALPKPAHSYAGTDDARSKDTGVTSISNGFNGLSMSEPVSESETDTEFEHVDLDALDEATKTALLAEIFPNLNDFAITHTLNKCNHKWQPAVDDLLNQGYFAEASDLEGPDRITLKGVDAFLVDDSSGPGRKAKRKRKNRTLLSEGAQFCSLSESDTPIENRWQTAPKDIDFIATRSNLPASMVRSAYYSNHASTSDTIVYLLKDTMKSTTRITSSDPIVQSNAVELGKDFPTIASEYLVALIRLTHPSTTSAHELAKALIEKRPLTSSSGPVVPQYAPPSLSDDEYEAVGRRPPSGTSRNGRTALDRSVASSLALSHSTARRGAIAQAQAAYRKSRSNHLMAGAAGYYAQVGRDHAAASQQYTSAAADALVDSQSSSTQLDLHGVTVQDAVRIAHDRVETWWNSLGESRINGRVGADDRAKGFTIVTGAGRHSEGGKGKLGPAVSRALAADGWRVEAGSGSLLIRGKQKGR